MTRSFTRPLGALVAFVFAAGLLTATTMSETPPEDRARPGYTLTLPDLAPLAVEGGETRVLAGVHEHAGYAIEVPPQWNGELVMWAHGFRGNGGELLVDAPGYGLRERFVAQGYAWAASSYDRNGYDVASGVTSTRALVDEFTELVGAPSRTYLAGVSMGGQITARSLEEFPGLYAGGLPMCGALGDAELFDYFLDFQLTAEALSGVRAYPPGPEYGRSELPLIEAALGLVRGNPVVATPTAQQLRDATILRSGGARPGAGASFALWKDFLFDLGVPSTEPSPAEGTALTPIDVAGNLGTDYGPDSPVDLDAAVQRVAPADQGVRDSTGLTPVARVTGEPGVPVLSLHDLGDLFVPFVMEQTYAAEVAGNGQADLLVQRAIRAAGHCEFSDAEAATAWDDLVTWVEQGVRPAGDDVRDAAVVADPAYGCAFTDPAAATAVPPPADSTRHLFEPCP